MSESTAPSPDITLLDGGVNQTVNNYLVRLNLAPSTDDTDQALPEDEDTQIERQDTQRTVETTLHTTEASVIARRALDKASTFFREKAEAFSRLPSTSRRIGTVAAASLALTAGHAILQETTDKAPTAVAAEVDYGTGGYPWANSTPGTGEVDGNGQPIRECTAWVAWKLSQRGVDIERLYNWDVTGAVTIDAIPAVGAAAITADNRHILFVEAKSEPDETGAVEITLSDYNGYGGPYKYGIHTIKSTDPEAQSLKYAHFELPDPRGPQTKDNTEETPQAKADVYANLKKLNGNVITVKRPIREGSFLESKDGGQYRLVVNKGDIKLRDTEAEDKVKWSAKTNKQATQLRIRLGKGKQRGRNYLTFGNSKKDYRKWNIGSATKIVIGVDGKLAGYNGEKQEWGEAKNLAAAQRAATRSVKSKITKRSAKNRR